MPWIGASDPWRLVLAMASAKYLTVLYGKHGNFSAAGRTVLLCGGVVAAVNPYRNSLAASPVVWHCQGVEGLVGAAIGVVAAVNLNGKKKNIQHQGFAGRHRPNY